MYNNVLELFESESIDRSNLVTFFFLYWHKNEVLFLIKSFKTKNNNNKTKKNETKWNLLKKIFFLFIR